MTSPGPCWRKDRYFRFLATCTIFALKLCIKLPIDFFLKLCYTIIVKRRERVAQGGCDPMNTVLSVGGWTLTGRPHLQGSKKFLKTFQKPLDKLYKVCYNVYTK